MLWHDTVQGLGDKGLQLLQKKVRAHKGLIQSSMPLTHFGAEWHGTKASLQQLRDAAHGHASALDENVTASGAELVSMLAMLEGLYNRSKEQISSMGVREKKSNDDFKDREARHNEQMTAINASFENGTLSEESHTKKLQSENQMWAYWQKVRALEHRQYLTSLSIKHSMMNKMKVMIDLYKKVIDGSVDDAEIKKEIAKVSGKSVNNFVVLLQDVDTLRHRKTLLKAITHFCEDVLAEMDATPATF